MTTKQALNELADWMDKWGVKFESLSTYPLYISGDKWWVSKSLRIPITERHIRKLAKDAEQKGKDDGK